MGDLDLQFLEDKATQWPGTEFSRDVLDLIQRLRAAEAAAEKWKRQAETYHSHVLQIQDGGQATRIAQLERVRKAAAQIHYVWRLALPDAPFGELDAALAAIEEPIKT